MTRSLIRPWQYLTLIVGLCGGHFAEGQAPAKLDPPVKPTVTGRFTGNGKPAAIKYVTVMEREPFSDKEAIALIFSEKDASASKKPDFDAMFGRLGSSLSLSVFYDGGIFGCEVSHSAHEKRGFSAIGEIKMVDFKIVGGNVSGHVTTGKELDAFGNKWEVDLTFTAPLPEKLRNRPVAPAKSIAQESSAPEKEEPKAPAGPLISASKVPVPKDATDVQFKALLKNIQFSVPRPVAAAAKDFSASLKQQGWKNTGSDLIGKPNAILKREQGEAKLTIMIQPAGPGSVVKIFTDGLDWTGVQDTPPAAAAKTSPPPSAGDIEAQAQKALKDALNGLPAGLRP